MTKMAVNEMISKFWLELAEQDGKPAIRVLKKPTKKQLEDLKAAKDDIIEELQRRAKVKADAEAKEKAEKEAERQAILNNEKPIEITFYNGEYLSGFTPSGVSTEIMKELGLAKHVSGWGLYIDNDTIEALGGKVFYYRDALALANARKQAEEEKKAAVDAARQAKFNEAKATGKPVLLQQWSTGCCDPKEECSMDMHHEYAMPDGTVKHEWNHTW
ncbi:MAG: hypothetical protein HPY70_14925 [Firmicutes bacterium]|nr:hypothetical protein [Bacillota bacterium]